MELNDYFLIVYDIIKFCKENDIYVGPGRGSAGASTALYFLNVTEVLPLEHNLIFERFVNPTRKTMADIDLDFSEGGRDKILEYLVSKYGQEAVMNVSTFGTYKPKSALQAMSRGLGKPTGQDSILMKKISKLPELVDKDSDSWNGEQLISYFEKVERVLQDEEIITWIRENKDVINFSAKILGNITIGSNSKIGANSVVVTDVPENSTAVGVPARIIKKDNKRDKMAHNELPDINKEMFKYLIERITILENNIKKENQCDCDINEKNEILEKEYLCFIDALKSNKKE